MGKKIGLLGGSFNPIHRGHLKIAETVLNIFPIEKCLLVPNYLSPHKGQSDTVTTNHRVEMIKLALKDLPKDLGIELCLWEVEQKTTSFTIDTLKHFVAQGVEPLFVMGADSFCNFPGWKDYRRFWDHSDVVVISRPTAVDMPAKDLIPKTMTGDFEESTSEFPSTVTFKHKSGRNLYFVNMDSVPFSSYQIRHAIQEGKDASQYLPHGVMGYIYEHNLYST